MLKIFKKIYYFLFPKRNLYCFVITDFPQREKFMSLASDLFEKRKTKIKYFDYFEVGNKTCFFFSDDEEKIIEKIKYLSVKQKQILYSIYAFTKGTPEALSEYKIEIHNDNIILIKK